MARAEVFEPEGPRNERKDTKSEPTKLYDPSHPSIPSRNAWTLEEYPNYMTLLAGLCLLMIPQEPKTNFFETPELKRYQSVLATLKRYEVSYFSSQLTGQESTYGQLVVDGDRFLVQYLDQALAWNGKSGVSLDLLTGARKVMSKLEEIPGFGGFYLLPSESTDWPKELDSFRLIREKLRLGKRTVETGWSIRQGWVDTATNFTYWFDPLTGLLSEVVISQDGMTTPSMARYVLTWNLKPVIPANFPALPPLHTPPEPLRHARYKVIPSAAWGHGVLSVRVPKGVGGKLTLRMPQRQNLYVDGTSARFELLAGPYGLSVQNGGIIAAFVRSRMETTIAYGAISNTSRRDLKLANGTVIPSGKTWAFLPAEYEVKGRKPLVVVADKITTFK